VENGEQMVFRVTDIRVPTIDLASVEAKNMRGVAAFAETVREYLVQLESDRRVDQSTGVRQIVTGARGDVDDN
jgi:hypothetical protein